MVGLSIARALALSGRTVFVLEQDDAVGTQTSSRNSEVIHAGIYYPPGSLKSKLCVAGKQLLYQYLSERNIVHQQCEKLIVATSADEVPVLKNIYENAQQNGVLDLTMIDRRAAKNLEPELFCEGALLSPSTGIFDSHEFMQSLVGDIENAGSMVVLQSKFIKASVGDKCLLTIGAEEAYQLEANILINAAGLYASDVAYAMSGFPKNHIPQTRFAKGRYFSCAGKAPFQRLIYPLPTPDSQGTHYTTDLGGQGRLGPDIIWGVERGDYEVEESARSKFFKAAQAYWPAVEMDKLQASYAGNRPKIAPKGVWADFMISTPVQHGVPGIINLFGIESPGLTSSLAIGEYVNTLIQAL